VYKYSYLLTFTYDIEDQNVHLDGVDSRSVMIEFSRVYEWWLQDAVGVNRDSDSCSSVNHKRNSISERDRAAVTAAVPTSC